MSQSTHKSKSPVGETATERNPLDMTDEEFAAKADESWRHYKETGLHLTQEEVEKWMEQRARGERVPMPKLHT